MRECTMVIDALFAVFFILDLKYWGSAYESTTIVEHGYPGLK